MSDKAANLFPEKSNVSIRIYAYSIQDDAHAGMLKIGQTTRDVKTRVSEQLKTAGIKNFTIELDEFGEKEDGSAIRDHHVRQRLLDKGFELAFQEWVHCSVDDVKTALTELKQGITLSGTHHETFALRPEQAEAVKKTQEYFQSIWKESMNAQPRFLWNAKMRFGKTFAAYQLAKKLGAKRVLVVTFKPAVADAWQHDLESHADFDEWTYLSKGSEIDAKKIKSMEPFVYFGSFQDLLGKDAMGKYKPKNEWLGKVKWDLVILDEYHFGAWRDSAKELFEGEDESEIKKETDAEFNPGLNAFNEELDELNDDEKSILSLSSRSYLYLSGTPFRALATGEFIEEQIFNWTYTDEQKAKKKWTQKFPNKPNPYAAMPEMRLMTYQMPAEILSIAMKGEFDEFDLNEFFSSTGRGENAAFKHKNEVQKWLDIIRGSYAHAHVDDLKLGASKPPFPYSDVRVLPYLQHSFWFLPNVAACHAMANLLNEKHNLFFHEYMRIVVAGTGAGVGLAALPPVREAIRGGQDTKTIVLSCGKLTTGVTVPQWSSILMLRNLQSPETYFQAAFRVQSPWAIKNPNGDNPHEEDVLKPAAFIFDFAPTRALRQISEYGMGLNPGAKNPEDAVKELVSFLPVLAYDGSHMKEIDAGEILDYAMSGTSATLLARKWESALLVNVDNDTLKKIMGNKDAMEAIMNIEGFRALGGDVFEKIINKSEAVKKAKKKSDGNPSETEKKQLSEEEKQYKALRKQVQEKLIKFATRIPAFMYLTDYRENTLKDVITKLEPELFKRVTGLTVADFNLLVNLNLFNSNHMNNAVFAFRRYEDASLSYTGIDSHEDLRKVGLFDTVIEAQELNDDDDPDEEEK